MEWLKCNAFHAMLSGRTLRNPGPIKAPAPPRCVQRTKFSLIIYFCKRPCWYECYIKPDRSADQPEAAVKSHVFQSKCEMTSPTPPGSFVLKWCMIETLSSQYTKSDKTLRHCWGDSEPPAPLRLCADTWKQITAQEVWEEFSLTFSVWRLHNLPMCVWVYSWYSGLLQYHSPKMCIVVKLGMVCSLKQKMDRHKHLEYGWFVTTNQISWSDPAGCISSNPWFGALQTHTCVWLFPWWQTNIL